MTFQTCIRKTGLQKGNNRLNNEFFVFQNNVFIRTENNPILLAFFI
jgi:hypothetical protein